MSEKNFISNEITNNQDLSVEEISNENETRSTIVSRTDVLVSMIDNVMGSCSIWSSNNNGEDTDKIYLGHTEDSTEDSPNYYSLFVSLDTNEYPVPDGVTVSLRLKKLRLGATHGTYLVQDIEQRFSALVSDDYNSQLYIPIKNFYRFTGRVELIVTPITLSQVELKGNSIYVEYTTPVDSVSFEGMGVSFPSYGPESQFNIEDAVTTAYFSDGVSVELDKGHFLFSESGNPESPATIYIWNGDSPNIFDVDFKIIGWSDNTPRLPSDVNKAQKEFSILGGKMTTTLGIKKSTYELTDIPTDKTFTGFGISHLISKRYNSESVFGNCVNLNLVETLIADENSSYNYRTAKNDYFSFKKTYYYVEDNNRHYVSESEAQNWTGEQELKEESITANGWIFTDQTPQKVSDLYLFGYYSNDYTEDDKQYKIPTRWLYNQTYVKGFNSFGKLVMISDNFDNVMFIDYTSDEKIQKVVEYHGEVKLGEYVFTYVNIYLNRYLSSITDTFTNAEISYGYDSAGRLISISKSNADTLTFNYWEDGVFNFITSSDGYKNQFHYNEGVLNGLDTLSTATDVESEKGKTEYLSKITMTVNDNFAWFSDQDDNEERVYYDNYGNETERATLKNGVYTSSEKYEYTAYNSFITRKANETQLYKKYSGSLYEGGEVVEETLDEQNNVTKRTISNTPVTPTVQTKTVIEYLYDQDKRCTQETQTVEYFQNGSTTSFDGFTQITTYEYTDNNQIAKTVSWINGEETQNGKSVQEFVYNAQGNVIKEISYNTLVNEKFISERNYNQFGQTVCEKDETGEHSTVFEYDPTKRLLSKITDPKGGITDFSYDIRERIQNVKTLDNQTENENTISYVRDEIAKTESSNDSSISYEYELKRRIANIKVDDLYYQKFTYEDRVLDENSKRVNRTTKTNAKGEKVRVEEEVNGNFAKVYYNDELQVKQTFNKDGTVSKVEDFVTGETEEYVYDDLGNLISATKTKDGESENAESVLYDNYGNVSKKTSSSGNTVTYTYKDNAERDLESISNSNWFISKPLTDKLKRNTGKQITYGNSVISQKDITYLSNTPEVAEGETPVSYATSMPETETITSNGREITLSYVYDSVGNITEIKEGDEVKVKYAYDSVNRLIREDNAYLNQTKTFTYDNNGNILSSQVSAFTLENEIASQPENVYEYTKDKLTKFNGKVCLYDGVGNPTTYKGVSLTWGKGRRLSSYGNTTFAYDGQGRRIGKNGVTYSYDSENRIISSSNGINFYYDHEGVAGFAYNGTKYIYEKDIFGNIISILDNTGAVVVKYVYDAWGTHKAYDANGGEITDNRHIGGLNPFRYRSYFYDAETKLYYLKSRYYDPETCRFINMDAIEYADPETVNGLNLFAYCNNNPVNYKQRPVSSGGSITDSALSGTLGGGFMPIINPSSGGSSIFNSVLANGSFRNGLFFGKGTITGLYASGHARAQISLKNGKFVLGAFGKFSLLNATGQIGISNDDFSVSLVGVGDIGTVSAMAGILIDPKKNTYFAGIEAKAAVFTARGGVQFEIFDTQIEIGGSVSALSAGFQFGVGIKDGEFYFKSGFAALFGYDFYIRIKFA